MQWGKKKNLFSFPNNEKFDLKSCDRGTESIYEKQQQQNIDIGKGCLVILVFPQSNPACSYKHLCQLPS